MSKQQNKFENIEMNIARFLISQKLFGGLFIFYISAYPILLCIDKQVAVNNPTTLHSIDQYCFQ